MSTPKFDIGKTTFDFFHNPPTLSQPHTWYEPQTTSTSDVAKEKASEDTRKNKSVVIYLSDHQSIGHGRKGGQWIDQEPGSSLLSSWSFLLDAPPQPIVSCLGGLAVFTALNATWPALPWSLKAPNDVFLGEHKVAGLLTESIAEGETYRLIFGLGLNVWSSPGHFPSTFIAHQLAECGASAQDSLSTIVWHQFIARLHLELSLITQDTGKELSSHQQQGLLHALNLYPHLKEPYTEIEPNGSLVSASSRVNWLEL